MLLLLGVACGTILGLEYASALVFPPSITSCASSAVRVGGSVRAMGTRTNGSTVEVAHGGVLYNDVSVSYSYSFP